MDNVVGTLDAKKAIMYVVGVCGLCMFRLGVRTVFADPVESSIVFWGSLFCLFVFERWVIRIRKKWKGCKQS